ncbi:oxidoreductase [Rhodococcus erythropolis]|nr:oxidoreductase [Rhodococcus erythropolis]
MASIGARLGGDMLALYGPSKAAVIEMSHSVARIGATRGLRSNTVMPGLILTDMWLRTIKELRRRDAALAGISDADVFDSFVAQMVPMGRAQTPGDIAEMVAFLLSDKARNVTGQTIAVDGGAVMT